MSQLPSTHLDMAIIPEGWTNWSGCQDAIKLVLWLVLTAIIHQSTNHHGKPHDTPHASHTLSGKIIIGGSYGIRHPSTSCRTNAYDLHICAGQRCSNVPVHNCNLFEAERCPRTAFLADFIVYSPHHNLILYKSPTKSITIDQTAQSDEFITDFQVGAHNGFRHFPICGAAD